MVVMDTKLTLRLDKEIIEKAKFYAQKHNQSLSSLTENLYKNALLEESIETDPELSPIAQKYLGILKNKIGDEDEEKLTRLKEKHLR